MGAITGNNAVGSLAASITAVATTFALNAGQGALFPATSAGYYFYATLQDASGNLEIIKVTQRTGDTFNVVERAQGGTSAQAFAEDDLIECRPVAAMFVLDELMPVIRAAYHATQAVVTPTTGSITVDFTDGNYKKLTLTGNATLSFTFPGVGHYQLRLISGTYSVTWPGGSFLWLGSLVDPVLSNGTDGGVLSLFFDGTDTIASYTFVGF